MIDANQALVDDSLALLTMKRETCHTAEVIIHWASRLIELVRPLVKTNSVIVCAPPSACRDHLAGIQLVVLAVPVGLEVEFITDGLMRTHPIEISVDRERGLSTIVNILIGQ